MSSGWRTFLIISGTRSRNFRSPFCHFPEFSFFGIVIFSFNLTSPKKSLIQYVYKQYIALRIILSRLIDESSSRAQPLSSFQTFPCLCSSLIGLQQEQHALQHGMSPADFFRRQPGSHETCSPLGPICEPFLLNDPFTREDRKTF